MERVVATFGLAATMLIGTPPPVVPAQESRIQLTGPVDGAKTRLHATEVRGRIANGLSPVVLVQPLVGRADWYVQRRASVVNGEYRGVAFLGTSDQGDGQRYRICVAAMTPQDAAQYAPEQVLEVFPPHVALSSPVTVIREPLNDDGDTSQPRRIEFAKHVWYIKRGSHLGPGPNEFDDAPSHIYVDARGQLHLRLIRAGEVWRSAEVFGDRPLGYGEYRWVVEGSFTQFAPHTVLGLFLHASGANEIDFELSRWGRQDVEDAQFVLQPHTADSLSRFSLQGAELLTVAIRWSRKRVEYRCWAGIDLERTPLHVWNYEGSNLQPATLEVPRMNLWINRGILPNDDASTEVVIRSFTFTAESGSRP